MIVSLYLDLDEQQWLKMNGLQRLNMATMAYNALHNERNMSMA